MKAKQNCRKFSVLQKYHVDASQPALYALGKHILEQSGWLNKRSGTK